jgi:hypothetical protein
MVTGCLNEDCENPLCDCENLEADIMCTCSKDDECPCCVGIPD